MANRGFILRIMPTLLGAVLVVGAVLCLCVWFIRAPLAERALGHYCAKRGLVCSVSIETLSLRDATGRDLDVAGSAGAAGLKIETVRVDFAWPSPFQPMVKQVRVERPVFTAQLDETGINFDGLDRLFEGSGGKAGPPVRLVVTDGQIALVTPAGLVEGTLAADLTWPEAGGLTLKAQPVKLQDGAKTLDLDRADLLVEFDDHQPRAELDLVINTAVWDGFSAQGVRAALAANQDDVYKVDFSADLSALTRGTDLSFGPMQLEGNASVGTAATDRFESLLQAVSDASFAFSVSGAVCKEHHLENLTAQIGFGPPQSGERAVRVDLNADHYSGPDGAVEAAKLGFDGRAAADGTRLTGAAILDVQAAGVSAQRASALFGSLTLGGPFSGHAQALRSALSAASSDFDFSARFGMELDRGEALFWQLTIPNRINISAESGAQAALHPNPTTPSLVASSERIDVAGLLQLAGGGLPTLSMDVQALTASQTELSARIGGVSLEPWQVGQNTLSADLNRVEIVHASDLFHFKLLGEGRLAGDFYGVDLSSSRLFGGVEAARGAEGWRVQTLEQDCLGLDLGTARIAGDLRLKPVGLRLCPEDGRFVRLDEGVPTGRLRLGDVNLPFEGANLSGAAALENGEVRWRGGRGFTVALEADRLNLPMQIGPRTLGLESAAPSAELIAGKATLISAVLGKTALSGSLMPANVSIDQMGLDVRLSDHQLTGFARSSTVLISDDRTDPLYEPLLAELNAQFSGRQVFINGPVRLAERRAAILGDGELRLDLTSLSGSGKITSRDLRFQRGGLQAHHLSKRLLGVMSNTRGRMGGHANFQIDRGKLSASGAVSVTDLGFDTARIGAVDGVTGTMVFTDLLALTSAPGQRFSIGRVKPGLLLENGEVVLQLVDGRRALIEQAAWPLAGGKLVIDPAEWTIGGESDLIEVRAEAIELKDLLGVLNLKDVQADGTVSGRFPIELTQSKVEVRDSLLTADDRGGSLKYLGAAAEQAGLVDERVNLAFEALKDFRFKVLQVGVDGNLLGNLVLTVKLLGANPDVLGGAEFDFNISLESALGDLIQSGQSLSTSSWITRAIAEEPERRGPEN